jgi:TRAP-type C4-dicarboxylate transport system substrate-binding protein
MRKLKWNIFVFVGMMLVLIFVSGEALPAAAPAKTITLKVACHMAPGTQMSVVMEWWCKEIEKRTNGMVKPTYYPLDS